MNKALIVGDVHGCLDEFEALIDLSGIDPLKDELYMVGDLVAKGPDSIGVLKRAKQLGARAVQGNHEHAMLSAYDALQNKSVMPSWIGPSQQQVAQQISRELQQWVASWPLWRNLEEHTMLVVHAGLRHGVALDAQTPHDCRCLRSILPDGSSSTRGDQGVPWASLWLGPQTVVFGHDAIRGLQRHRYALGLDTGCVYGRELSGLLLPDRKIISVPAKRTYCEPGIAAQSKQVVAVEDLPIGEVLAVELTRKANSFARQALVIRDITGTVRAYLNECRHLPIPLDAGSGQYLTRSGEFLMCSTHGALYRIDDGYCIEGPCAGQSLKPIQVRQQNNQIFILDEH